MGILRAASTNSIQSYNGLRLCALSATADGYVTKEHFKGDNR